jgi:hypothetical protein
MKIAPKPTVSVRFPKLAGPHRSGAEQKAQEPTQAQCDAHQIGEEERTGASYEDHRRPQTATLHFLDERIARLKAMGG